MIVDLYAGPGGLDHGAELTDLPSVGIEWDASAVATRVAAGLATVHGDVRTYGPADFPDANVLARFLSQPHSYAPPPPPPRNPDGHVPTLSRGVAAPPTEETTHDPHTRT